MHPVRSRLSLPVYIFLILFYGVFILAVKQAYDNYHKYQRFEKYHNMMQEITKSIDVVEMLSRRSVLDRQQYQGSLASGNFKRKTKERQRKRLDTLKPP